MKRAERLQVFACWVERNVLPQKIGNIELLLYEFDGVSHFSNFTLPPEINFFNACIFFLKTLYFSLLCQVVKIRSLHGKNSYRISTTWYESVRKLRKNLDYGRHAKAPARPLQPHELE